MSHQIPSHQTFIVSSTNVKELTGSVDEGALSHLISNHDEADTRLILHACDCLKASDTVVIRTVDTDVLVIALHHLQAMQRHTDQDVIMHLGTGVHKRYISLAQLHTHMPSDVRDNMMAAYALTGCDTTSGLFRITKSRAVATLETSKYEISGLGDVDDPLNLHCREECHRFLAGLYGDYPNLTEARYKSYANRITKTESQLPPSANAADYHIKRAAYQLILWKSALTAVVGNLPAVTDFGWNQAMRPVMCDPSPVHDKLLISCNCKTTRSEKNNCKCYKNSLRCTDACCCQNCANTPRQLIDGIDSSDEDMSD